MYTDNTLTPKEAVRLCALGTLASGPMHYSDLANSVRHFMSRILGPSLDVMGTSIQLLLYEDLITAPDGSGIEDNARLEITDAGHDALRELLTARLRSQSNDMNKLITALKFRFLHLLPADDRLDQVDLLLEAAEGELTRLLDLRTHHADDAGHLTRWLDHDIESLERRIAWLQDLETVLT